MAPGDVALMLLVAAVWGFNFIATRTALEAIPPLLMTTLRFVLVAAVLLPFVSRPRDWRPVVTLAFWLGVVHFSLMFWAVAIADRLAPLAVTVQLNLPFAALLAAWLLGERLGPRRAVGAAVAVAGVVLMTFDPNVLADLQAVLLAAAAAFFWALANVLAKRLATLPAGTLNAYIALVAVPPLLLLSLAFEDGQVEALRAAPAVAWAGVAYNALAVTVFGYGVWFRLLRRYPVNLITPFVLTVPVFAALFAIAVFGESLSWQVIIGGLVLIGGVAVVLIERAPVR